MKVKHGIVYYTKKKKRNTVQLQGPSMPPVHSAPEDPVFDITECRRKEARFFHKVWYRPIVVMIFLREVNPDDLWGVRTVVVKSRWFKVGIRFRKVKG